MKRTNLFLIAVFSVLFGSCVDFYLPEPADDDTSTGDTDTSDTETGTDADTDTDTDTDSDTNTGTESDLDVDTDSDTDTDSDSDTDVDSDTDSDSDTDTDSDADSDTETCSDESDCESQPCVDGYCCDGPCDGLCQACDVAEHEGACTPIPNGEDPEDECDAGTPSDCGMNGSCDGASACAWYGAETPCSDELSCTDFDACDGKGLCAGTLTETCEPGESNVCCVGLCSEDDGCYTEASECVDVCNSDEMTVGRSCAGCGEANAEGICTGGAVYKCTAVNHTKCDYQTCGGTNYYCTNVDGAWAWRTTIACDDDNACTYNDACVGGTCIATSYTCMSDDCMVRECDGLGDCIETPNPEATCGTTACPTDKCEGGDWFNYPATCTNQCSEAGECDECECSPTTETCGVGGDNDCCLSACSPSGGCSTVAGSCGGADSCLSNIMSVTSTCTGCGANNADGVCAGGGIFTCNSTDHTACENRSCGGETYYCTNVGNVWAWRSNSACDDGNACTYGDTCSGTTCGGTEIDCDSLDTTCADYSCDGDSVCAVAYAGGSTPCDDGEECTYGETCTGTSDSCEDGTTLNCDALDTTCKDYYCDGDSVCGYTVNAGLECNDGNSSTYDDTCQQDGDCEGTPCTDVNQSWTFSSSLQNWSTDSHWSRNSSGYLQFYYNPTATNYSYSATSPTFTMLNACTPVTLSYRASLDDFVSISETGTEYLRAECYSGTSTWTVLRTHTDGTSNDASFGWTTFTATVPSGCQRSDGKIRFRASGTSTYYIDYWYVDTVSVTSP